jgi:hypothetical protein
VFMPAPSDRRRESSDERDRTLPEVTDDEREIGWGDDLAAEQDRRDEDWYRRERPPHHE